MWPHFWRCHRAKALTAGSLFSLTLFLLIAFDAHPQPAPTGSDDFGLGPGTFSVGFRLLEVPDETRAVTGGVNASARARPIRIYLWYPASAARRPMSFGQYVTLADDDIWPEEIAGTLRSRLTFSRRPLARSLSESAYEALLQKTVLATDNAAALTGDFPLIVVGQGLYYESPIAFAALCEFLAGRGFVVATAPLVGMNSPLVRNDVQDLETQVRDLEFVIARARELLFVSQEQLGVLGFDQGGMAGVILTMRNPGVDAFVSLDAGILYPHPSGMPGNSPDYDSAALRVPWLHATPPRGVSPPPDSEVDSLMETAIHANRFLLVTDGMEHVDFTSYALIEERRAMPNYWSNATAERAFRHAVLAEYIHRFFAAFLKLDTDSLASFDQDPEDAFPGSGMSLEHRPAVPQLMGYDELVQAVVSGRAEQAVDDLRQRGVLSGNLDEAHLIRLVVSLLYTWGLAEESIPLVEYMAEVYESSSQAQGLLAENFVLVGNYDAAIEVLLGYVRQHPDDRSAQSRLEQVRELARSRQE